MPHDYTHDNPPNIPQDCQPGPWVPGLTLTESIPETIPDVPQLNLSELKVQQSKNNYISVYSDVYKNSLAKYFTETTMSWINGDGMLYRPGLIPEDVWKYDISGESEYGLIEPPINEPNYDLFDSNWAAQFVVFARRGTNSLSCQTLNLDWCSYPVENNPERGPDSDIHVNCPAQNRKPIEPEPTYLELYTLYKEINECKLIEEHIGSQYLGCIWNDPNNPCSCNCPEQGVSFGDYLAYTRTYATFWDTPHNSPLYRIAQMGQLQSNILNVEVISLSKDLKLGSFVKIMNPNRMEGSEPRKTSGLWLITEIEYLFETKEQKTKLTLMRDTNSDDYKANTIGWSKPIYLLKGK